MSRIQCNLSCNHPCLDGIFVAEEIEYPGVIQMKQFTKELIQSIVMGAGIPALLVSAVVYRGRQAEIPQQSNPPAATTTQTLQPQSIRIPVLSEGRQVDMDVEEYLLGVLLAEMPANFETEALKAQAVAARTFTLFCCTQQGNHSPAAICTESTCCQGYLSPLRYIQQGGTAAHVDRLKAVLAETAGQVVCYEGALILASYFSCSGGSTEDAQAVWGQDYPYLKSVESPGEEHAVYHTDQKVFSKEEFETALSIQLNGMPGTWFGVFTYTQGGGVKTADICGTTFRGTELRQKLGLRSTALTFAASENTITVYTRGYGHRVGLSQYGADAMALTGSNYKQILKHYYPGTSLDIYRG